VTLTPDNLKGPTKRELLQLPLGSNRMVFGPKLVGYEFGLARDAGDESYLKM